MNWFGEIVIRFDVLHMNRISISWGRILNFEHVSGEGVQCLKSVRMGPADHNVRRGRLGFVLEAGIVILLTWKSNIIELKSHCSRGAVNCLWRFHSIAKGRRIVFFFLLLTLWLKWETLACCMNTMGVLGPRCPYSLRKWRGFCFAASESCDGLQGDTKCEIQLSSPSRYTLALREENNFFSSKNLHDVEGEVGFGERCERITRLACVCMFKQGLLPSSAHTLNGGSWIRVGGLERHAVWSILKPCTCTDWIFSNVFQLV